MLWPESISGAIEIARCSIGGRLRVDVEVSFSVIKPRPRVADIQQVPLGQQLFQRDAVLPDGRHLIVWVGEIDGTAGRRSQPQAGASGCPVPAGLPAVAG